MINFLRTVNSLKWAGCLSKRKNASRSSIRVSWCVIEAPRSAHVVDRYLSGVYHIRNSSAGTAAPVTVEKVSIPRYEPLSNDDSDDAAVARASLRGVGGRRRTLCCGGQMDGGVCGGGGGGGGGEAVGDGGANDITVWETVGRKV
jgi:hypothetical protein